LNLILRSLFLGSIGAVALGAFALNGTAGAEPGGKETICHNAGQSGNVVQITVSTNAGTTNPGNGGHLQDKHQDDKDVLVGPGQVGGPGAEVFKDGADCAKKQAPPQAPEQPEKPQAPAPQQPDVKQQAPAPQQVAPQQVAPQQVAPQQVAPQQVAPQQVAPQQAAPPRVAPQQVGPQQIAPPKAGSGGLLEGNATSGQEGALPWLGLLGASLLALGGGVLARRSF
jgi:outer membrane biosynthesis protein TonB